MQFKKADVSHMLNKINDWEKDKDGNDTATKQTYIVGWTLVPNNMMHGGLANFFNVDALDGAGMRMRAQGVLLSARGVELILKCRGHVYWGGPREGNWSSSLCLLTAGIMIIRGTRDANNNLHPISMSRFFAPENDRAVGAHIGAELQLGLDLNRKVRLKMHV